MEIGKPPFKESNPRVPAPLGDSIFYYDQVDLLAKLADGKAWTYADIRPDPVVSPSPRLFCG